MEIIELTEANIERYMDQCLSLHTYLVTSEDSIDAQRFIATAKDPCGYFIGIVQDDRLVGMGLVSRIMDPVRIIGYVNNIVVHPNTRGQGFFAVIMDALERKAKEWGCDRMELTCSREAVQGLYEKRGYLRKDTGFYFLPLS